MGCALHLVVVFLFACGEVWAFRGMECLERVIAFLSHSQKKCISYTFKSKFTSLPTASVTGSFVFSFSVFFQYFNTCNDNIWYSS